MFTTIANLPEIEIDAEFSNYGFDSIGFTSFANQLNEMYGLELMPTLFFECSNLRSLADSLIENHLEALLKKYKPPKQTKPQIQVQAEQIAPLPATPPNLKIDAGTRGRGDAEN